MGDEEKETGIPIETWEIEAEQEEENDEEEEGTEIPVETLDDLIDYLEEKYNELTSGDMPDSEGICIEVAGYIKFLKKIRKLYRECAGCGRLVAPNE